MAITPPPTWPIEPTTLYTVAYYATNSVSESPAAYLATLVTYEAALQLAKDTITNAGNVGVCTIQPVTATVVYPAVPWVDF